MPVLLLLISLFALTVGLIAPRKVLTKNAYASGNPRKKVLFIYGLISLLLFVWIGLTAEPTKKNVQFSNNEKTPEVESIKTESSLETVKVEEVIDGDTIRIITDTGTEKVRLIGIDTPETKDPRKSVECYGQEASDKLKELIEGKEIQLEKDPTQGDLDKYNRLLRYVFVGKENINQTMIAEGFAHEYTYSVPYKYQTEFKQAQKDAEAGEKGLWAPDACVVEPAPVNSSAATGGSTITTPPTQSTQPVQPAPPVSSGVVKKSSTGICHAPGTTYYDQTKNYTSYSTIQECLDSGGRLPKR